MVSLLICHNAIFTRISEIPIEHLNKYYNSRFLCTLFFFRMKHELTDKVTDHLSLRSIDTTPSAGRQVCLLQPVNDFSSNFL